MKKIKTDRKHIILVRSWFASVLAVVVLLASVVIPQPTVQSVSIAEEFSSSNGIVEGTVVSIKKDNPSEVELANLYNSDYLAGVVGDPTSGTVIFSKDNSDVAVALSGDVVAFVSDINGQISKGDLITTSVVDGIGMKASLEQSQRVIGVALEDMVMSSTRQYTPSNVPGLEKKINVGKLLIRLYDHSLVADQNPEVTQSAFERFFQGVAGKDVSYFRILISFVLFILSIFIGGVFLSNAIKGSFISLGRNPLASSSIYVTLIQVSAISVVVLMIGSGLAYTVLVL